MNEMMERRGPAIEPREIMQDGDARVRITWADGRVCSFEAPSLRRSCPCAGCVNEWTGEKTLDDAKIPEDISLRHTSIVGRYALNFHFSDGHDTGIFSFGFLRKLSDQL